MPASSEAYLAARKRVALADLSSRTRIRVQGQDAFRFLNNLCSNDVVRLQDGSGCESFLCSAKGGILFHVFIFRLHDALWLDAPPGLSQRLLQHLDRYLIREKVVLSDETATTSQFSLIGPKARDVLTALAGPAAIPAKSLQISAAKIDGVDVQIRCTERSRSPCYDVVTACPQNDKVWTCLKAAGNAFEMRQLDADVVNRLRVEAGLPEFGVDLIEGNLPQEADRNDRAISFTKGCYLGQETVARLDSYGHVNKELRGLVVEANWPGVEGSAIFFQEKEVGRISSAAVSPDEKKVLALAVVKAVACSPRSAVVIRTSGGPVPALIERLPFTVEASDGDI